MCDEARQADYLRGQSGVEVEERRLHTATAMIYEAIIGEIAKLVPEQSFIKQPSHMTAPLHAFVQRKHSHKGVSTEILAAALNVVVSQARHLGPNKTLLGDFLLRFLTNEVMKQ